MFVQRKCLVQENVRKSSGLPICQGEEKGLGTPELEKMHVLNPIYPSRRKLPAFMGRPMPENRWKTSGSRFEGDVPKFYARKPQFYISQQSPMNLFFLL